MIPQPTTAPAPQSGTGDKFTFTTDDQSTQVVFYPVFGPIVKPGGPAHVDYTGAEGHLLFSGDQVRIQDSPLGKLISVTLPSIPDTGIVTFTLVLPPVKGVTRDTPQTFDTIAVKAKSVGFIDKPGAQTSYSVLCLDGTAELGIIPLEHSTAR